MADTTQERLTTIRQLVESSAPRKPSCAVDLSSSLRADLGFDSIGLMTLAFKLETIFDVDLSSYAEQYAQVATVADVLKFVEVVLGAAS